MEKITYLVANYNNGKYIEDCIQSLREQTESNWLCLIGDDKSTDNSLEIIRPLLNDKIQLLTNEKNAGKVPTLKKLIKYSLTDIVAILDPDDMLFPEATEYLLKAYNGNPGAAFVYSKCAVFDEALKNKLHVMGNPVPSDQTSLQMGLITAIRSFRISAYRKTSGYDEAILYAEDRDLIYKMEEVAVPVFVDRVLYKYRMVPGSQSNDLQKKEIGCRNHLRAIKNALQRRNISGFEKWFYHRLYHARYMLDSDRFPLYVKRIINTYVRSLYYIDGVFQIRSAGKLNRQQCARTVHER